MSLEMVKLLAFDTSTDACSAALCLGTQRWQRFEVAPRRHAELLLGMIADLLNTTAEHLRDLDGIAYGHGPGSFMGVRIATSIAQALGFAQHLPVLPISSLQALAQEAWQCYQAKSIVAAWDARMNEVYWGGYQVDEAGYMQPMFSDRLSSFSELQRMLADKGKPFDLLVGNVWEIYRQQLLDTLPYEIRVDATLYPTAAAIATLAVQAYQQGRAISALSAEPFYLRNQVVKKKEFNYDGNKI